MKTTCSLVIGGFINGYSIVKELYDKGLREIVLVDTKKKLGAYSNKIVRFIQIEPSADSLHQALRELHQTYERIVIFPTSESQLEQLHELYEQISPYCFLPFNNDNLIDCLDKIYQYQHCERVGIPYPNSVFLETEGDLAQLNQLTYPIILKPSKTNPTQQKVFRNLVIYNELDFALHQSRIVSGLEAGIHFLASEVIPGDSSNVYAYVGYRSKQGVILNEWMGKKLSQYPDNFGIFASASNQSPREVLEQGRKLLETMNLFGICEPEFRLDPRDGLYKLMEVNLRSTMWNRIGTLSGVDILYTQYLDAIGEQGIKQTQRQDQDIHFVYFKHEFLGLIKGTIAWETFWRNIFRSDQTFFAVFDWKDLKPFCFDLLDTCRGLFRRAAKAFRLW